MSGSGDRQTRMTLLPGLPEGNNLFRGAAVALGLEGHTARLLLHRALTGAGYAIDTVTPEELAACLAEIEVLVRKLLPPDLAKERLHRLQRFLLDATLYPNG